MASTRNKKTKKKVPAYQASEIRFLVDTDPDFVNNKRAGFSLRKLKEAHPDACSNRVAAQALGLSEKEVEQEFEDAVAILRSGMGG